MKVRRAVPSRQRYYRSDMARAKWFTGVALGLATAAAAQQPRFAAHEIATGLRGGYQVVVADVNGDGKPDLIALASNLPELAWYENPTWTRHVIAGGFTGLINIAALDLDGDRIPEIAVASGFSTRPSESAGIIAILTHGADVTQPWTSREIDRVPSAHRLRWYTDATGQRWLLNAPLAASTAQPPNYDGATPIFAYRAPDWKRESLPSDEHGVVHAIEPVRGLVCTSCVLSAGFAGIHRYERANGEWSHVALVPGDPAAVPKGGSSDVAVGRIMRADHGAEYAFLAAIEPWHGNQLVTYHVDPTGKRYVRTVVDTTIVDGHTLVAADLDGDGSDEIVVGQRGGTRSLWMYRQTSSGAWSRSTLDDGGMAAAGCAAADLNGDGRIDIACIGTATANLKWYESLGPSRSSGSRRNRDLMVNEAAVPVVPFTPVQIGSSPYRRQSCCSRRNRD
jgi:VCBS repeat protein/aldos-2-ulose dehydratase/isomerase family protein